MSDRPIPVPPPRAKCGWCDEISVTDVVMVKGKKTRKTVPVCETHAAGFEDRGQITVRLEQSIKQEKAERSRQWKAQHLRY